MPCPNNRIHLAFVTPQKYRDNNILRQTAAVPQPQVVLVQRALQKGGIAHSKEADKAIKLLKYLVYTAVLDSKNNFMIKFLLTLFC